MIPWVLTGEQQNKDSRMFIRRKGGDKSWTWFSVLVVLGRGRQHKVHDSVEVVVLLLLLWYYVAYLLFWPATATHRTLAIKRTEAKSFNGVDQIIIITLSSHSCWGIPPITLLSTFLPRQIVDLTHMFPHFVYTMCIYSKFIVQYSRYT